MSLTRSLIPHPVLGVALAVCVSVAPVAEAQGVKQIVGMPRLDPTAFAMGFRATKLIGMTIASDTGERIGRIEDVIISRDGMATRVVVSAGGGFMGLGARLVLVPYADLRITEAHATLPGATVASLQALPEFRFAR